MKKMEKFRNNAPVKVDEVLEVTIESIGTQGDGIAKKDGFVIFIKGTEVEKTYTVKIMKVFAKIAFAEIVTE